ncbi:Protein of unknown function [Vibrio xiamenensis]|uniref:DUF2802 domain-containing protein n=1 Tax=Vibrio xiamenensis TaxID=861298 RepID=A0A1G8ELW5_9VIBR|nr:DUF2802 domain-containing protein [Vibrio xiamenensis]SDH70867.1 Protein of unknown function [Vibrio xiamenensis]
MSIDVLMSPPVIAGGLLLVWLLFAIWVLRVKRSQRLSNEQFRQQNRALDKELQKSTKQLLELRSVLVGLGQQISEQQDIIQHLNDRITELEQADGDGRLYSRASKMVQLGADIDELIQECELPKAEAELMLSLQKKLAGHEKIPPLSGRPENSRATRTKKR